MENKIYLKKYLSILIVLLIIFFGIMLFQNYLEYSEYKISYNKKISSIVDYVIEKYPSITKEEILEILNSKDADIKIFRKFGYDINEDSFLANNDRIYIKYVFLEIGIIVLMCSSVILVVFLYSNKNSREIRKITNLVEQINRRNYELEIDSFNEDELSILKSEICKTTIMLKEVAENSIRDKVSLKNSLSDISHQLKTPLTSILIMLDAIIDDTEMDEGIRDDFIINIKREILNLNFLVQSILKLSKFDANSVNFVNKRTEVKKIIEKAVLNVSTLCDLKNVCINITGNEEVSIIGDFNWQVEAITNILKNCVEHSYDGGIVSISFSENKVYVSVLIKDEGTGIAEDDIPHIFERFYKGKNSSKDSVGIGLALSKTIIESGNGRISLESEEGKYTKFEIKYFK